MRWSGLLLALVCIHVAIAGHSAMPPHGREKAANHDHWEHIVKRSLQSRYWDDEPYEDDAAHIVNVQEYYREVFESSFDDYAGKDRELMGLLHKIENAEAEGRIMDSDEAFIQEEVHRAINMITYQKPIRGRYIVIFTPEASDYVLDRTVEVLSKASDESGQRLRANHITTFRHLWKGFAATMNSRVVDLLRKHPLVATVEEDTALRRSAAYPESDSGVIWNLDRLDQHENHLDGQYAPEGSGEGVDIYIIDTGIRYSHKDLEGRAHYGGFDAIDELTGSNHKGQDDHGHGTHCAGTAAGRRFGVAKQATIYSVKALDSTGTGAVSGIVMAMNKIVEQRETDPKFSGRPAVMSLSLGLETSEALNTAVTSAAEHGIVSVVAAGNQGGDSCDYSPASARTGIAVGATDSNDRVMTFSNTGACTDLFAPGHKIVSAGHRCDDCTHTLSGTSMACPHVTGYAAILLGLEPKMKPAELKERVIGRSTKNMVNLALVSASLSSHTQNRLLYVPPRGATDSDTSSSQAMRSKLYSDRRAGISSFNGYYDPR